MATTARKYGEISGSPSINHKLQHAKSQAL